MANYVELDPDEPVVAELQVVVTNPATVLKTFDQIMVYRSVDNGTSWDELTVPGSRIPIAAGVVQYGFADPHGDPSYTYAFAYYSTQTGATSALSMPISPDASSALDVLSIADLKTNYLFGLNLKNPSGQPMPDSLFAYFIASAVAEVERRCDIAIQPLVVKNERQDYFPPPSRRSIWNFRTYKAPIQSVQRVALSFPGLTIPYTFPTNWCTVRKDLGRVSVFPRGNSPNAFPVFTGPYAAYANCFDSEVIVDGLEVDYVAGFPRGQVPPEVLDCVGKMAAYGPLNIAGDLLGGAGVASSSLSMDGLSQSINTTSSPMFSGYGARLSIYQKEVAETLLVIRRTYRGIGLGAA